MSTAIEAPLTSALQSASDSERAGRKERLRRHVETCI